MPKHKHLAYVLVLLLVANLFAPYLPGNTGGKAYAVANTLQFFNNHNISLGPGFDVSRQGAYQIVGADDDDKSAVAYCMDFTKDGPNGATYKLSASRPDQILSYLIAYGYPNRIFKDDPKHSRIITQIAIWCHFNNTAEDYFERGNFPDDTVDEALDFLAEAEAYAADVRAGRKPAFSCGWIYTTTDPGEGGKPRQRILLVEPSKGKGKIVKSSSLEAISKDNESYSLQGAVYGVYQSEAEAKKATKANPGTPVARLTTGENGTSNEAELHLGEYYVKELVAPAGYALDTDVHKLRIEADETTTLKCKDMPQSASVELILQKVDAETQKPMAQGAASIKDAEYKVSYYAGQFDSEAQAKAANVTTRSWIFKTDEKGQIKLDDAHKVSGDKPIYKNAAGKYCFPVGTIIIKETKVSEGYKLDGATYVHKIAAVSNGSANLEYCNAATSKEQMKRADMMGIKIGDTNMKRLAGVPFLLTSKTTGEAHVIVTDENGQFATTADWASRDESTNANDTALSEDGKVDESKLSDEAGVWFNGYNDPETGAPAKNPHRALPYDTYEMKELRCEANKGYDLVTFEFVVKKEGVINLGTLTDDQPEVPEIGTTAIDKSTGGHIGNASEKVTIVDTVQYEGLTKGQEYKLTGTLMDKATGNPIEVDGKPITAETSFKAKGKTGSVDVEFTFPGSAVKGKTTVVFEKLYQEDLEVAVHADIEDEDQTVIFPEIGTKAALMKDGSILDTVSYSNLKPGKTYTMVAHLVDKKTGKAVKGTETKVTFKPSQSDGSMEVAIDTSKVKGKTVVVFEECLLDGKVIAEHKDLKDKHQTVTVPGEPEKPGTPKSHPKTGDRSSLGLLICLALISGGTLIMALKRKKHDE